MTIRFLVFGNSGSGKSTYGRALADREGIPHLDLDSVVWEPNQIAVPRSPEAIRQSFQQFLAQHEQWVIEGCYGELVEAAAPRCTQLVFLNPGLAACLANNARRPWEPHKYASVEQQNAMLATLSAWVTDYYHRTDQWSYQAHRRSSTRIRARRLSTRQSSIGARQSDDEQNSGESTTQRNTQGNRRL